MSYIVSPGRSATVSIDQELLTNIFTPFLSQALTLFYRSWGYSDSETSGQLPPTRWVRGLEGGPIPRFGGSIHPIIINHENWSKVSLWVGECKNAIAYQISRWGPQVSWGPIPRFGGSIHPIIINQEILVEVSLWVGNCKNTIAYQIWRWDPIFSCVSNMGVLAPVLGGQFTPWQLTFLYE